MSKDSTASMLYANLSISRNAWERGNSLCQMYHLVLSISENTKETENKELIYDDYTETSSLSRYRGRTCLLLAPLCSLFFPSGLVDSLIDVRPCGGSASPYERIFIDGLLLLVASLDALVQSRLLPCTDLRCGRSLAVPLWLCHCSTSSRVDQCWPAYVGYLLHFPCTSEMKTVYI